MLIINSARVNGRARLVHRRVLCNFIWHLKKLLVLKKGQWQAYYFWSILTTMDSRVCVRAHRDAEQHLALGSTALSFISHYLSDLETTQGWHSEVQTMNYFFADLPLQICSAAVGTRQRQTYIPINLSLCNCAHAKLTDNSSAQS